MCLRNSADIPLNAFLHRKRSFSGVVDVLSCELFCSCQFWIKFTPWRREVTVLRLPDPCLDRVVDGVICFPGN